MSDKDIESDMKTLFDPENIVVIGVSLRDEEGMGRVIFENLREEREVVYAVNPKAEDERDFFRDIKEIPADIDLAVIAVPAEKISGEIEDCVEADVENILIIAGGFEGGKGEREEQVEVIDNAIDGEGSRILGPNTIGLYCPSSNLDTLFVGGDIIERPREGNIAFISQSGFLSLPFLEGLAEHQRGIHSFVGIGDRYDIDENELIQYLLKEERVEVISLYLESFVDGREFYRIVEEKGKEKGVVLLKGGTSEKGKEAVRSHTDTIARESKKVLKGLCEQAGVIMVEDEQELLDFSEALDYYGSVEGSKVAIVSSAGGMGVIAADYIDEHTENLETCVLSERIRKRISRHIGSLGSPRNPIDLTPKVTQEQYDEVLRSLNEEENVDSIVLYLSRSPAIDDDCLDTIMRWHENGEKALVVILQGGKNVDDWRERFWAEQIPIYPNTSRAMKTLDILVKKGKDLSQKKRSTDEEES